MSGFSSLLVLFFTIFLAELGDKTQLATMLFASEGERNPWVVFTVASLALVTSTAIAVLVGSYAAEYAEKIPIKLLAGSGFVLIGGWMIMEHIKG